jgi:hypothetical protein
MFGLITIRALMQLLIIHQLIENLATLLDLPKNQ